MREKSPGVWELRVHLGKDFSGSRKAVSKTFRGGKRAAASALADLVREIPKLQAERLNKTHHVVTVADLVERWWTLHEFDWAPNTVRDNRNVIDLWISTDPIAKMNVKEVHRSDLELFYNRLHRSGGAQKQGLSATSVRKVHNALHAAFEEAIRMDMVQVNPARGTRRPKRQHVEPEVPTLAEIQRAIEVAPPQMACIIRVAIATGARRSELAALTWGDIDFDAGTIRINKALSNEADSRNLVVRQTKTGASAVLAVDDGTLAVLRKWRISHVEKMLALGIQDKGDQQPVWSDRYVRGPVKPHSITEAWRRIAARAGIPNARFHDLRHAAATHMIAAGVDVRTVAGRLRHSSPSMTLDVYASRSIDADRAAANLVGQLLDGSIG